MIVQSCQTVHTTLQLPCKAITRYTITALSDFASVSNAVAGKSFRVLGGGSNVLCAAPTLDNVVQIAIKGIELMLTTADAYFVRVGAGECWHDTVMHTLSQGWPGLENLALIPGWVGAAPVQNIGAYGVELCERLHSVHAWDTRKHALVELLAEDCGFAYRDSLFKHSAGRYWIASITLKLPRPWQAAVHYGELAQLFGHVALKAPIDSAAPARQALDIAHAVISIRQRKLPDPARVPNAGSFFKNPIVPAAQAAALKAAHPLLPLYPQPNGSAKLAAGWLIEHAGWKGHTRSVGAEPSVGTIGVHAAQALVLVHLGGANGADLLQLSTDIQADILAKFGVVLEREVNVWQ
jgi:UDP-N-acetylmuramate dehydrogenase